MLKPMVFLGVSIFKKPRICLAIVTIAIIAIYCNDNKTDMIMAIGNVITKLYMMRMMRMRMRMRMRRRRMMMMMMTTLTMRIHTVIGIGANRKCGHSPSPSPSYSLV